MAGKTGTLEINEDLTFQRREWRAQHVGWFALCAFLAAALLGLFGGGPLSRAEAGERGSPLWIEYERFVRRGSAERMTVHVAPGGTARETLELRLSRDYFDRVRVEHVHPAPDVTEVGASEVVLRFSGPAAERSAAVVLDVEPLAAGRQTGTVAIAGAAPVTISQFVYF